MQLESGAAIGAETSAMSVGVFWGVKLKKEGLILFGGGGLGFSESA